jgi:N utilization substance protein B
VSRRTRARRLALQGLCCLDVQGADARDAVEQFIADSREPPDTVARARELLWSAFEDRAACDALLSRHARQWGLARLALVDRNILRLAAHELRSSSAPYKVVITEALALAKEFSSAQSPRFINGILDAAARELRGEGAGETP